MVMFFGLTNSPATFQVMMNELLRDLINMGKVAVFIDDVIVGTETEEGHNELVVEVIRRLEENDLYVKLKKCRWKVKKVEFFGSSNRTRGDKNGKRESEGGIGMANTQVYQRYSKVSGISELLSSIH